MTEQPQTHSGSVIILNCSPSITVPLNTSQPVFLLQTPTSDGYLRGLPRSELHSRGPWGSFKSQRPKEPRADHGVRAKTAGTRRTLGPGEGKRTAQRGTKGDQPPGDCVYNGHFRRLDFSSRPPQTFGGPLSPPRPAPFLPPPAARSSRIRTRRTPGSDWRIRARGAARPRWKAIGACAVAGGRCASDRARPLSWRVFSAREDARSRALGSLGVRFPGRSPRIPRELAEQASF